MPETPQAGLALVAPRVRSVGRKPDRLSRRGPRPGPSSRSGRGSGQGLRALVM